MYSERHCESSLKVKLKDFNRPLVAGCCIGPAPSMLTDGPWANRVHFSSRGFLSFQADVCSSVHLTNGLGFKQLLLLQKGEVIHY